MEQIASFLNAHVSAASGSAELPLQLASASGWLEHRDPRVLRYIEA